MSVARNENFFGLAMFRDQMFSLRSLGKIQKESNCGSRQPTLVVIKKSKISYFFKQIILVGHTFDVWCRSRCYSMIMYYEMFHSQMCLSKNDRICTSYCHNSASCSNKWLFDQYSRMQSSSSSIIFVQRFLYITYMYLMDVVSRISKINIITFVRETWRVIRNVPIVGNLACRRSAWPVFDANGAV